ncbi:MAG: MarC family protein [Gammaproteobacteria bacterium]
MEHWTEYTRFTTALLVILDPFIAIPLFLSLTQGQDSRQRMRIAFITSVSVGAVLVSAAVFGDSLLAFMGTSLSSFRVGGGIVLLLMALAMLRAESDTLRTTYSEKKSAEEMSSIAVVPLAIPMLAGPGAISTVIIQMQRSALPLHPFVVIGCILLVCVVLWMVLSLAMQIGTTLGRIGMSIIDRLFGLLLAAISIEIIANGLRGLFPVLE